MRGLVFLYISKAFSLAVGVCTVFLVSGSLGAQDYGKYTYILSIGLLFLFLANFSIDTLGIKHLANSSNVDNDRSMTSLLSVKLISGIPSVLLTMALAMLLSIETEVFMLVVLVALAVAINPAVVFEAYFFTKGEGGKIAFAKLFSLSMYLVFVAFGSLLQFNVVVYLALYACEMLLYGLLLLAFYVCAGGRFRRPLGVPLMEYFSDALPIVASTGVIVLYNRVDIVMIEHFLGYSSVGIYSLAIKISEATTVFSTLLLSVVFPYIMRARDQKAARSIMESAIGVVFLVSIFIATCVWVFSDLYLPVLVVADFEQSIPILKISIISMIFSNIAVAGSYWLIYRGQQKYRLIRALQSLVINIALNFYLIPKYGLYGAVYATLASQLFGAYFGYLISRKTWEVFRLVSIGVSFYPIYQELRSYILKGNFTWSVEDSNCSPGRTL